MTELLPSSSKKRPSVVLFDFLLVAFGAVLKGFSLYYFVTNNDFAPSGVNGIAVIAGKLLSVNYAYLLLALNLPLLVLVTIYLSKYKAAFLIADVLIQNILIIALTNLDAPYYTPEAGGLIYAAIAHGIVFGVGSSLILGKLDIGDGFYAVSALAKRFKPGVNLAWLTFLLSAVVVAVSLFVFGGVESAICTIVSLYICSYIVDKVYTFIKSRLNRQQKLSVI